MTIQRQTRHWLAVHLLALLIAAVFIPSLTAVAYADNKPTKTMKTNPPKPKAPAKPCVVPKTEISNGIVNKVETNSGKKSSTNCPPN